MYIPKESDTMEKVNFLKLGALDGHLRKIERRVKFIKQALPIMMHIVLCCDKVTHNTIIDTMHELKDWACGHNIQWPVYDVSKLV